MIRSNMANRLVSENWRAVDNPESSAEGFVRFQKEVAVVELEYCCGSQIRAPQKAAGTRRPFRSGLFFCVGTSCGPMIGSIKIKLFFIFTWLDFSKGGRTSAVLVNTVNNFFESEF